MRRFVAIAAAAALVLAACNSDNEDDDATSTSEPDTVVTTVTTAPSTTAATTAPTTTPGAPTTVAPTTAPTTAPAGPDLGAARITLTEVARVEEPIVVALRPGDTTTYIAQRDGRLRALRDGDLVEAPVLDISGMISSGGERGFLGATFSPDGNFLYVNYTDTSGNTNIDEYAVAADGSVDAASRRRVLFQEQPYANHNGGEVIFGPDGYLYIGLGDGGSGGDPQRRGMDLGTWLGKILRIDPRPDGDQPYGVPADNPFVGRSGAKPEIWSYGLRNPWRFSFDAATHDLWIADVGQGNIEEIDVSTVADGAGKGVNFGWSAFEGRERFNADQPTAGTVAPVYQYTHAGGGCSVTGGFVYRGSAIPALQGAYVFSDYCSGGVRAIALSAPGTASDAVSLSEDPGSVSSFGESADGELYVCSLNSGVVYRLDPA